MPATIHQAAQSVAPASTPAAVTADLAERQLLDIKAVGVMVGLKSSTIQHRVRRDEFPEPVSMGARCSSGPAGALGQWIQDKIETRQEEVKLRQQVRAEKASSAVQAKRQTAIQATAEGCQ
jgi:predicted DNA-binding transcriptional regulator AlpA